jgi:hypothetical protein
MDYQKLYDEFMQKYKQSETTPSQVGETLARIAGFFPNYNMSLVKAERAYAIVHKNVALETDDATGKAISSAKAETIAEAAAEAGIFKEAKAHIENIEMLVGSLKFLQKSLEVEYVNSNI